MQAQIDRNRRSRELNPCDPVFWTSRGWPRRPQNWKDILESSGYYDTESEDEDYSYLNEITLHSRQCNPCDQLFWKSRGWPRRPDNWTNILKWSGYYETCAPALNFAPSPTEPENYESDSDDYDDHEDDYDDHEDDDDNGSGYDEDDDEEDDDDNDNGGDDDDDCVDDDNEEEEHDEFNDPSSETFWISRGWKHRPLHYHDVLENSGYYDSDSEDDDDIGNISNIRSRENNPCDPYFWKSRGWPRRPYNWRDILNDSGYYDAEHFPDGSSSSTASASTINRFQNNNTFTPQSNVRRTSADELIRNFLSEPPVDPYDQLLTPRKRNPEWKAAATATEYNETFPENNRCSSCVIYVKNYFLRCGHLLCAKCAEHLYNTYSTCPFCRKSIDDEPIQIFINV